MDTAPIIFDTKRLDSDDDEEAYSGSDPRIKPVLMRRYYALSFLAERGELTARPVRGREATLS